MGKVRPFKKDDIPQAVELNTKLFPMSINLLRETQEFLFNEVCFNNPWQNPDITSLVYEEANGRISGFLSVIPRHMEMDGKPITVAVSQHLMVDRTPLASLQLFKKFLSGPQDLSFTDMAIDVAKKIWERLEGTTIYSHSIYWRRPLRPLGFALSFLKKGKPISTLLTATKPALKVCDSIVNKISLLPFHFSKPNLIAEDLTTEFFLEKLPRFTADWKLKPVYSPQTIQWLFKMLMDEKRFGNFQKIILRDAENNVIGWYLYNLKPGGRSEVIQIVGSENNIKQVLDHLFYHAWKGGSVELCGRLEPKFMKAFTEKNCLFMPGRNWMLAHSRDPKIIQTLHAGDAFLTRLEGDLWLL